MDPRELIEKNNNKYKYKSTDIKRVHYIYEDRIIKLILKKWKISKISMYNNWKEK